MLGHPGRAGADRLSRLLTEFSSSLGARGAAGGGGPARVAQAAVDLVRRSPTAGEAEIKVAGQEPPYRRRRGPAAPGRANLVLNAVQAAGGPVS